MPRCLIQSSIALMITAIAGIALSGCSTNGKSMSADKDDMHGYVEGMMCPR